MSERPEIPTIVRDMNKAHIQLGAQDGFVLLYVGEIHDGDEAPVAVEAFPVSWQLAKQLFLSAYMLACGEELKQMGAQGGSGDE